MDAKQSIPLPSPGIVPFTIGSALIWLTIKLISEAINNTHFAVWLWIVAVIFAGIVVLSFYLAWKDYRFCKHTPEEGPK